MESPGTLLHRAKHNGYRAKAQNHPTRSQVPEEKPCMEPMHYSSHATYSALMRSHDRVRTRHIPGKGGPNGA